MAEPRLGGTRSDPPAPATAEARPHRPRPVLPLLLATVLTLVVVLATMRGDGDAPTLVASQAPLQSHESESGADGEAVPPASETDQAGHDGNGSPDDDTKVLGTTTTPVPQPTPTVRVEDLPLSGSGEFVGAPPAATPSGAAPHRRFAVAVETGIGVDVHELAAFVDGVLADQRSWIGDGVTGFQRVGSDQPVDFIVVVATPDTVDRLCAPLQTARRYSCAANGWVALNLHRWMTATPDWPASLEIYRRYLVNHEVGHYVLGPDHDSCPEPGAPAPIMMQQTIDLAGCRPNGWVFPRRS